MLVYQRVSDVGISWRNLWWWPGMRWWFGCGSEMEDLANKYQGHASKRGYDIMSSQLEMNIWLCLKMVVPRSYGTLIGKNMIQHGSCGWVCHPQLEQSLKISPWVSVWLPLYHWHRRFHYHRRSCASVAPEKMLVSIFIFAACWCVCRSCQLPSGNQTWQ